MTEPKRRFDIEPKTGIPTLEQWGAYKRQMALYFDAVMPQELYRAPIEPETLAGYARRDADLTMTWWQRFAGEPVLVNKLRGRAQQAIFSLNDLIHPGTIDAMTPEPQTPGCGCVR